MTETLGFIGLGDLGRPIAGNLMDAGYELIVHNRTAAKADLLVARGARWAKTPAEAVPPGGLVVTLLWDDASVEEVVASEGFLERLGPGGAHVSMSTVSPAASQRLAARHAAHGSHLVEAPIFGRPEAATARQLWIAYAGPRGAVARVQPLFEAMGAQGSFDFGEAPGAACAVKLAGNFLIIAAGAALTEALTMVRDQGFDAPATVDMLTRTLFPAPIYQSYGRMIAARPGGPPMGGSPIPGKDLGLFRATASAGGSPTALTDLLLALRRA